jgi:hypothetical protein
MGGSPSIPDWQELEHVRVSTAHTEEVAELLLRYAASEMSFAQLVSAIRLLCEEVSHAQQNRVTNEAVDLAAGAQPP